MEMKHVNSSNLVSVGYDPVSKVLVIKFHSGTYEYYDVPQDIHRGLMSASSKGSYHHQFIKDKFRYKKIG